jgi:hypothetical protein
MNLGKRLRAYIIGIGIGTILVFFIFKDKSALFTGWLPNNRVLYEIRESRMATTPHTACILQCMEFPLDSLKKGLISATKVDFSQSSTHKEPRTYCLMQDIRGTETCLMVSIADSVATISDIRSAPAGKCQCP